MIDLRDCTFIIPVHIGSPDRLENLDIVLKYISENLDTHVLLGEQDEQPLLQGRYAVDYFFSKSDRFHRTKVLNQLLQQVKTKYVVNCDADAMLPLQSYEDAAELLRQDRADLVYPCKVLVNAIDKHRFDIFAKDNLEAYKDHKVHGAIFFITRDAYVVAGGENQNFTTWGGEDIERLHRLSMLGYRVSRCGTIALHLQHRKVMASHKGYDPQCRAELLKVVNMDKEALLDYIKTWPWLKDRA